MSDPAPSAAPEQDPQDLLERTLAAERAARSAEDWIGVAALYQQLETALSADHRFAANRGNALWLADQPGAALKAYWRAARLAPSAPVVLRGLGNVHQDLQAFELAERAYARSCALEPTALSLWNHSQLLIGLEQYNQGYALAESRWQVQGHQPWRDPATAWDGDPHRLRLPLLVWSEQGFGDILQHLRWLGPLLLQLQAAGAQASDLVLELEPSLAPLVQDALAHLNPAPRVLAKMVTGATEWPASHIPLLSLPHRLGGAPVPAGALWLQAAGWTPKAQDWPARPRIGIVWGAGRKLDDPVTAREYRRRSLDPQALAMLIEGLTQLNVDVVLLQFGADRAMAASWRHLAVAELPQDADFASTAAWVSPLNLVISVDTAMAHLVGTMQREGWLLLPFSAAPRWLRQRTDTPWYPSLRLFRQAVSGEWQPVIAEVLQVLAQRMNH